MKEKTPYILIVLSIILFLFALDYKKDIIPYSYRDMIILEYPNSESKISSPLIVQGHARGTWFFEGDFPVYLLNTNNEVIGQGLASAKEPWMTEEYIPFNAVIKFNKEHFTAGSLILKKDDPSGITSDEYKINIEFK